MSCSALLPWVAVFPACGKKVRRVYQRDCVPRLPGRPSQIREAGNLKVSRRVCSECHYSMALLLIVRVDVVRGGPREADKSP